MMTDQRTEEISKLLVADDNDGLAMLIRKRLQAAGYHVDVTSNGAETIRRIRSSPPSLLLLDFRLPDMIGQEVVAGLKDAGCFVPFIVVTGAGDEATAVEMMKLGARDYLRKDLDFLERINGTVERVLTQIKIENQLARAQQALAESETRFKDLIYSMDDMVYETDSQQKIIYCSDQVVDVLGYTPEEMIGKNPFDFLDVEDRQQIIDLATAGFTDHMPIKDFEGWYVRKGGTRVCLLTSGVPIFDAQGYYCGFRGAHKDITNRKMAELSLSKNEAKFRSLVMNIRGGIILIDDEGTILEWNPAQENMTGIKASDVCGKKIWDIQFLLTPEEQRTPEHLSHLRQLAEELIHSEVQPVNIQSIVEFQRLDGIRRLVETTVFSLPAKNGLMMSSISFDITERKQTEDALRKENEELRQQVQKIQAESNRTSTHPNVNTHSGDILPSDKSRELRASLTAIMSAANTLLTGVFGNLNDKQKATLKDIEKGVKSLTALINDILDKSNG